MILESCSKKLNWSWQGVETSYGWHLNTWIRIIKGIDNIVHQRFRVNDFLANIFVICSQTCKYFECCSFPLFAIVCPFLQFLGQPNSLILFVKDLFKYCKQWGEEIFWKGKVYGFIGNTQINRTKCGCFVLSIQATATENGSCIFDNLDQGLLAWMGAEVNPYTFPLGDEKHKYTDLVLSPLFIIFIIT